MLRRMAHPKHAPLDESRTTLVLADVLEERRRQQALRGRQHLPSHLAGIDALLVRRLLRVCRDRQDAGEVSWPWVLLEEACEAVLAAGAERRDELVQVAAVACQWVEGMDAADAPATGLRLCTHLDANGRPKTCAGPEGGCTRCQMFYRAAEALTAAPIAYSPPWQQVAPTAPAPSGATWRGRAVEPGELPGYDANGREVE